MIANYFTLFHIARELNHEFAGQIIDEIFTQHKGELIFSFRSTSSVIIIGCEPSDNFIYMRSSFSRARRNSLNIFTALTEVKIEKINMHASDRQIHFLLNNRYSILVQMFGSKANVLLLNDKNELSDTFLKKTVIDSFIYKEFLGEKEINTEKFYLDFGEFTLINALKKIFPQFGSTLVQEVLVRSKLNGEQLIKDLEKWKTQNILETASLMINELLSKPAPRIYFSGDSPIQMAIIPLLHLSEHRTQTFDTVSNAVQAFRSYLWKDKNFVREKDQIRNIVERKYEHIDSSIKKILKEKDKSERYEEFEKYGKLLMAHLHLIKKGDKSVSIEDFYEAKGEVVEIPLDQNLTATKNAERYFEKARKLKHAIEEQQIRINELTCAQKDIAQLKEGVEEAATPEMLKYFIEKKQKTLLQYGLKLKKGGKIEKEVTIPFRIFTVDGGFQVWAGKSGENNDLLSTRYTAKNDLWFHARGVGGSHVVLKIGTGKGDVSKKAIEQTAGIAAYYSKMKNSKLVPVTMCEGKYVRKPKGALAGTVTVEREKTIFAEPGLP